MARQIIGADFLPYLSDNRKSSVVCFLASSFLFYLKNLTTVLNFLGKINPVQRDNYQYYVYKHDVNLISVPIMAHKHCQTLLVITKGP